MNTFDREVLEVKPAAESFEEMLFAAIERQWLAHLEAEAENTYWDEMARDAAEEAEFDRACEVGYGNW